MAGVVIVGAGQGGFQAAASLRQLKYEGPITLIGAEPGLPYQRPPLSKAYLKEGEVERLYLRPAGFYDTGDITLVEGEVMAIDRKARAVETADGRRFDYDHLILATGARNFVPPLPGADSAGIVALRTLADATALRERVIGRAGHAIVVGGGFIGLEFAAVARLQGWQVTVVEAADRVMARAVSEPTSRWFEAMHRALGVDIRTGTPAAELGPESVTLQGGDVISGDLVLLAAGIRPVVELAEAAGLETANGIVVDQTLRTGDPAIYALGDCAAFPDPVTGAQIRLESVQAATDHARTIAEAITGTAAPYGAVPWFWSDQADAKLQIAGLARPDDDAVQVPTDEGKLLVFRFRDGVFTALESVNEAAPHMAARQLLKLGQPLTRAALEAGGYDLRAALKEAKARAAG